MEIRKSQDHPRVCGEKYSFAHFFSPSLGSPPRVRGKALFLRSQFPKPRITPACAGKRFLPPVRLPARRDHPRVCGEKLSCSSICSFRVGSPPRVRGKDYDAWKQAYTPRITPACAGKSASLMYFRAPGSDHPRVCGEKRYGACVGKRNVGSPPRVRGKGFLAMATGCATRITPACAGKRLDFGRDCRMGDGSPPRVRGKVFFLCKLALNARITPACAGKS